MSRKLAFQPLVIQINVQIGQHGPLHSRTRNPVQRLVDMRVGRMRRIAKSVQNPQISPAHRIQSRFVKVRYIAGINQAADPVTD